MQGSAFVFINLIQAARFGHVGWGFSLAEGQDRYYFGSTDHLFRHPWWNLAAWMRYAHLETGVNNDWWSEIGTRKEMLRIMHGGHHSRYHITYHVGKEIAVPAAHPDEAIALAGKLDNGGWSLLVNNCVHQTYSVLTEYGATLPKPIEPFTNVMPKKWFAAIEGELLTF